MAGGVISLLLGFTIPWIYPEFYLFGELFVISLQTAFIVGGIMTIFGAILYAKNVSSAIILIIIGALVGGINIISLWGLKLVREDFNQMKANQELE
jgi:hypothetical protein